MQPHLTGPVVGLVLLVSGCIHGPGAADEAHFAREVGRGTAVEVIEKSNLVLLQHQFEIEQFLEPPQIFFQSYWRDRYPFEDELERGIDEAQIRVTIRARARADGGLDLYTVHMTIEQRVSTPLMQDWITHTMTPQARRYAQRIAGDLERRLSVGVHR